MKQLTEFLTRVMPMAPGCPQPVALQALLDACIDFCERTLLVRALTDEINPVAGQGEYELDMPPGATVARLLVAWYGDRRLGLAPGQNVTARDGWVDGGREGEPAAAYMAGAQTARVFPVPGPHADKTLRFLLATKPTRTATSVEDVLFDDWAEAIAHGALARLLMQPGNPYSNPDLALWCANQFNAGVSRARLEADKGRVRGDVVVQGRPFSGVCR